MTRPNLILASMSPRRRMLLALTETPFEVQPSSVDESGINEPDAVAFARVAAQAKCADVLEKAGHGAVVVGADTVVHFTDPAGRHVALGKPDDADHARLMLRMLAGRIHQVTTALAVAGTDGRMRVAHCDSNVHFRVLSDDDINAYVQAGESLDKAGAYAAQGKAAHLIERIEGDLLNVIGLPLALLVTMLEPWFSEMKMPPQKKIDESLATAATW